MTPYAIPIDITENEELARIAQEVEFTKKPRELRRGNKIVAVIMPAGTSTPHKKRKKTKSDYEAFRAAAGSWKDVDTDALKEQIYTDRRQTNARSSVKL